MPVLKLEPVLHTISPIAMPTTDGASPFAIALSQPMPDVGGTIPPDTDLLRPNEGRGRLFGYVRHHDHDAIARQVEALTAYAGKLDRPLVHIFEDVDLNALVAEPPGLGALRAAVRPNDDVVVAELCQLSRDFKRLTTLYEEWRRIGVGLHTALHGPVTTAYVAVTSYLERREATNALRRLGRWRAAQARGVLRATADAVSGDQTPTRRKRR